MYSEAKKLHIIEEVLKIKSESTLSALENFLKKSQKSEDVVKTSNFRKFSGIWSKDEAEEIEKIISESCETIHPDDWK
jgi:uncharacterized protein YbcI